MNGKRSSISRKVVISGFLLLLLVIGLYLGGIIRPLRTMFHNRYLGLLENESLPRWIMYVPQSDSHGNELYADFDLNILVIISNPYIRYESSQRPPGYNEGAVVQYSHSVFYSGFKRIVVKRTDRNRLFFVDANGVLGTATLSDGSAEDLYTYLELLASKGIHDDILKRSIIELKDNEEAVALLSNEIR